VCECVYVCVGVYVCVYVCVCVCVVVCVCVCKTVNYEIYISFAYNASDKLSPWLYKRRWWRGGEAPDL